MKIFNLACDNEHRFEGWFASGEEFDAQRARRLIACPLCGDTHVTKLPAAAYLNTGKGRPAQTQPMPVANPQQADPRSQLLAKLVRHVIENSEDVGAAFPEEARKIHYQEAPPRQIRGTASGEQVADLEDEGIEVMVLPVAVPGTGKAH